MHRQRFFERTKIRPVCECSDQEMAHWSPDGHCVAPGCDCQAFRPKKARNKYNAARVEIKGQHFDSKFEGKVGADLKYRQMCGEKFEVRRQVDFPFWVNGIKICTYRADYLLTLDDGTQEVVEGKGFEDPKWPIKRKLFEALYPKIRLIVEKERSGWRRR